MARKKKAQAESTEEMNDAARHKLFRTDVKGLANASIYDASEIDDPRPNNTGSITLDYDLVVPAPAGRYIEVTGDEGSGKSTLALEIAGQALLAGRRVLYINAEYNMNRSLLESIRSIRPYLDAALEGEEHCPLQILYAPTGEVALEAARLFASHFPDGIIVIDSVDALIPESVLAGKIGEKGVGGLPRLMSDALRKLLAVAHDQSVTIVFINQFRTKIEKFQMGDPRTPSGGRALAYYASQRIKLMPPGKAQLIQDDEGEIIGHIVRYKIFKNKCAPGDIEGEFPILYYNGIFREQELVTMCVKFGILEMGGRGGKQILMPKLKDGKATDETVAMKRNHAARRLILDTDLYSYLKGELESLLDVPSNREAVDSFIGEEDEVSDA